MPPSHGPVKTSQSYSVGSSDKHRRRIRMLLLVCSGILLTVGGAWWVYYLVQAKWLLMGLSLALVGVGAAILGLALKNRLRTAALLVTPSLLVVLCGFSLLDVPTPGAPRTVHLHLLSLAAGANLLFRTERPLLRFGLPLLSLLSFLIMGAGDIGLHIPDLLPPREVRIIGVWGNYATFIFTLGAILVIMQADVSERNGLEADLRRAIAEGQFLLHYQAQTNDDGHVLGAEVLLRWQHPKRGLIPPNKFIPMAEETGLIVPIGEWVLKTACAQLVAWSSDPGKAHLTLAVNVSATQLRQPDFVAQVLGIVERSGIKPALLKLELTESMLVKDIEDVIHKMTALKAHGLTFSLDDFGTGFSSLNYLKRLPLDQLKIDQCFVRDVLTDKSDKAIARTLISMSDSLGLSVIAEGVETESQRGWLRDNGCHLYQGYLFGKPMPVLQFEELVARSNGGASAASQPERTMTASAHQEAHALASTEA